VATAWSPRLLLQLEVRIYSPYHTISQREGRKETGAGNLLLAKFPNEAFDPRWIKSHMYEMHTRIRDLCVQFSGYTLPISYVPTTSEPGVRLMGVFPGVCVSRVCLSHGRVPLRGMPYRRAPLKIRQTTSPQAQVRTLASKLAMLDTSAGVLRFKGMWNDQNRMQSR
jgi:hypothetical protein